MLVDKINNNKSNSSFQLEEYTYYNEHEEISVTKRNLPHLTQNNVIYFVTFRLHDSIPDEKAKELEDARKLWNKTHKLPLTKEEIREHIKLFSDKIDLFLNSGHGSCVLKISKNKKIVDDFLNYFNGIRYVLDEYIIMPNHVHVFVQPINEFSLSGILHSWKSYSANKINESMGIKGQLWRHETFDHIVRSKESLKYLREYIRNNLTKRG